MLLNNFKSESINKLEKTNAYYYGNSNWNYIGTDVLAIEENSSTSRK